MNAEKLDPHYWQIVQERDRRFDGTFVYAVRSTGIYCPPSCPSRRPNPENVTFFDAPDDAEAAGFRACRRCLPREVHPQAEMVKKAVEFIEHHDAPTLAEISAHVHVSPFHLQRVFKRIMGISPRQYAESCRVNRLKTGLREQDSVTTALYDAGYNSSSRLYEKDQLGMTPSRYSKGGKGIMIRYTITDCALGRILIGTTDRGLCAVSFGDSDTELIAGLVDEYPSAEIQSDDARLNDYAETVISHIDGEHPYLDLPLDIQATVFQRRVWDALQAIPRGETRSYSEVAAAIGQPNATRAVANACGSNRLAGIIPCHRVVRENGDLGGYRWGIERKKALLEQEKVDSLVTG